MVYNKNTILGDIDEIRIKKILSLIGQNKHILDIGCYNGAITKRIEGQNNQVYGIDASLPAIKLAQKKHLKVKHLILENNWSKKINQKFDVVFAGEIIEHIFDTDNFLQNIRHLLKPQGSLIITTPNIASLGRRIYLLLGISPIIETTSRNTDSGHIRYFTKKTLCKLLSENGFLFQKFTSTAVNFANKKGYHSKILADLFPQIGSHIIIKFVKKWRGT